jgi:hypothetical protein
MKCSIMIVAAVAASASAQFIENSCPAPSDHITGITEGVFVVDSMLKVVYDMNGWTGEVYDTIPIPFSGCSPVGLARRADSLMFAGGGTAMIFVMSVYGDSVGTYDFSDSGIYSISGLSCPWEDLYIADDSTNTIWRTDLPLGAGPLTEFLNLQDCPRIHDIGMVYYDMVAVACEDPVSPVRIYFSPTEYMPIDFQTGECESAVGVGTCSEGNRFWFSDPDMGMIHRYCCDMGSVSGTDPETPGVVMGTPNPVTGNTQLQLHLPMAGEVSVMLLDVAGRLLDQVFLGYLDMGEHTIPLEVEGLHAGVYLLRAGLDNLISEHRFTILRNNK